MRCLEWFTIVDLTVYSLSLISFLQCLIFHKMTVHSMKVKLTPDLSSSPYADCLQNLPLRFYKYIWGIQHVAPINLFTNK